MGQVGSSASDPDQRERDDNTPEISGLACQPDALVRKQRMSESYRGDGEPTERSDCRLELSERLIECVRVAMLHPHRAFIPAEDYKDLVQETYLEAMSRAEGEVVKNPEGLFSTILKRSQIDWLRRQRTRAIYVEGQRPDMVSPTTESSDWGTIGLFQRFVRAVVTEEEFRVLFLWAVAGLTFQEIASEFDVDRRTIYNHKKKAMSKLRAAIESQPETTPTRNLLPGYWEALQ